MHHIVPKHMGGSDDPSNLVKLTVEEHAQAHLELYEQHGDERDLLAYRMLLGQITRADAIKKIQKLPKSEGWKRKARERSIGEGNPMYGKTQTERQKRTVGDSAKKRFTGVPKNYKVVNPVMYGKDNPMSRAVRVGDKVYDTVIEAAEACNVSRVCIRNRILNPNFPDYSYA